MNGVSLVQHLDEPSLFLEFPILVDFVNLYLNLEFSVFFRVLRLQMSDLESILAIFFLKFEDFSDIALVQNRACPASENEVAHIFDDFYAEKAVLQDFLVLFIIFLF